MRKSSIAALAALSLGLMNCTSQSSQQADGNYIGPSEIQIADGKMTPEVLLSFGRLSDPQLSPDGSKILYGVSYIDIDQNRSCRNLFVCNPDGSDKVQLTMDGKSISNARWSKDGKNIYFLQGGQIYCAPFEGDKLGARKALSAFEAGISEFKLSSDEKSVIISSTVKNPNLVTPSDTDAKLDKAQAYVTEDLMYRHWDNWVTEIPQSYVAPFGGAQITEANAVNILADEPEIYELPLMPFGGLEQLAWTPDGKYIAYSCKKLTGKQYAFSTNTDIYIYDVAAGKTLSKVSTAGGYDTDPSFSPDGTKLMWLSMERDGYESDKSRLFVADFANGAASNVRELTGAFKYNVAGPVWNDSSSSIYFNALTEGIQAMYKVDVASCEFTRFTDESMWYDFDSPFSITETENGVKMLASFCSLNFPTELVAVNVENGTCTLENVTTENEHILCQLKDCSIEQRMVKTIDGKDMLTWVMFPPEFDQTRKYPAIEICLGGPQGTLSQGWSYRWNYRLMAAQGYIVVMPNRRGTTAFGQEWTEQISGDYTGLNMQDYLAAGRNIKNEPYVDKLAACGASYGGFSVYYLAGIHGDLYDCFVAHAGIFEEQYMYYETEEMWFANWDNGGLTEYAYEPGQVGPKGDGITFGGMQQAGSPWSNVSKTRNHYSKTPAANVTKWHTPILCIHGCMDFRIPYDQGMAAFNAAQMMGVPSKLVIFPEECHWILQPQNSIFWHREYFDWLDKWCK